MALAFSTSVSLLAINCLTKSVNVFWSSWATLIALSSTLAKTTGSLYISVLANAGGTGGGGWAGYWNLISLFISLERDNERETIKFYHNTSPHIKFYLIPFEMQLHRYGHFRGLGHLDLHFDQYTLLVFLE